jgi:FkbM family methyltransferase
MDRLRDTIRRELHHRIARELHSRGIYRLGSDPFGAIDRNILLRRFGIDLLFDVGANVGGWARLLREGGYAGRIISIEPGSPQFAVLSEAADSDPLWEVHRAGAGDVDGIQTFNVASNLVSSSFLALTDRFTMTHSDVDVDTQEQVQIYRLDRFADQVAPGSRVWVKLDIEGYELRAIAGASQLLAKTDIVEVELTTSRLYDEEPLFYEVAPALYELGFELIAVGSAVTAPSGRTVRFDGLFGRPE